MVEPLECFGITILDGGFWFVTVTKRGFEAPNLIARRDWLIGAIAFFVYNFLGWEEVINLFDWG